MAAGFSRQKLFFLVLFFPVLSHAFPYKKCSSDITVNERQQNGIFSALLHAVSQSAQKGYADYDSRKICNSDDCSSPIYAVSRCRGDISTSSCGDCIANAAEKLKKSCQASGDSRIWLPKCYLHYSVAEKGIPMAETNYAAILPSRTHLGGNKHEFEQRLNELLRTVKNSAANVKRGEMKERPIFPFMRWRRAPRATYYAEYCKTCLWLAQEKMTAKCAGYTGCHFVCSGYELRYENYPFLLCDMGTIGIWCVPPPTIG